MFLVNILRLYAGDGGKPALHKACDSVTIDKSTGQEEKTA
jgi:hypothetical protein